MRPTFRRLILALGFLLLAGGPAPAGSRGASNGSASTETGPRQRLKRTSPAKVQSVLPKSDPLARLGRAAAAASEVTPPELTPKPAESGASRDLWSSDFRREFLKLAREARTAVVQKFGLQNVALALRLKYLETLNKDYKVVVSRGQAGRSRQGDTGRCWIFATESALGVNLSESFVNFYAWKTRAEKLLSLAEKRNPKKPIAIDASRGFDEGGSFRWVGQLIEQHGIVPQQKMPDTADGADTAIMIAKLKELIASAQAKFQRVRGKSAAARAQRKKVREQYAEELNTLLETTLGKPPGPDETFTFDGKEYNPKSYAKEVLGFMARDYVVLSNYPGAGWNKGFWVSGELGLKGFPAYNVSIANLEKAVRATIDRGEAVWFSTTVGAENPYITGSERVLPLGARNIMHLRAFDYGSLLPSHNLSKTTRLSAKVGISNHAMTFVGYDYDSANPNQITKLKVDDSASDDDLAMYRDFFKQYVDYVVVPRAVLPPEFLEALESRKIANRPGG